MQPISALSAIESQGFAFFRQHSAHEIPGCFDSTIWNQLVLQLSHREPCILHAAVAVGTMHHFTGGNCPSLNASNYLGPGNPFAIKQYIKSLNHLRERLDGPKDSGCEQVALMTCLLFICLEMLQGNRAGALAHLQTGLRILAGSQSSFLRINRHRDVVTFDFNPHSKASLSTQLAVIFTRLDYEATMFGQQSPALTFVPIDNELSIKLEIPDRFSTIDDARQSLDTLANAVFSLRGIVLHLASQAAEEDTDVDWVHQVCIHHARARTTDLFQHPNISRRHSAIKSSLERWTSAFKLLVRKPTYSDSPPAIVLELQHFYLYFLISTFRSVHETQSDSFNATFQRVISRATKLITGVSGAAARTSTFTLESGVIPSLYLVAMKCRDPGTREKAISLLGQTSCQEGMWEGGLIAKFAAEMAKLEERALDGDGHGEPATASDVPESARFCDVVVAMSEVAGHGRLVCARYLHESTGDLQVLERLFAL